VSLCLIPRINLEGRFNLAKQKIKNSVVEIECNIKQVHSKLNDLRSDIRENCENLIAQKEWGQLQYSSSSIQNSETEIKELIEYFVVVKFRNYNKKVTKYNEKSENYIKDGMGYFAIQGDVFTKLVEEAECRLELYL
jgi:hypothetical protein